MLMARKFSLRLVTMLKVSMAITHINRKLRFQTCVQNS